MKNMRVRKWLKSQKDKQIQIEHKQADRLGSKNLQKIMSVSPTLNKSVMVQTQSKENFKNPGFTENHA